MQIAFGGRLLTFFTAPNYPGRGTNDGVILNLALVKDQMSECRMHRFMGCVRACMCTYRTCKGRARV